MLTITHTHINAHTHAHTHKHNHANLHTPLVPAWWAFCQSHSRARTHTHTDTHTYTHKQTHTHTHSVAISLSHSVAHALSHTQTSSQGVGTHLSHAIHLSHSRALTPDLPLTLSILALFSRALTLSRARTLAHTNKQPRGGQASVALFSCTLFLCHSHSSVALAKETALSFSCTETPSVALSFSSTHLSRHPPSLSYLELLFRSHNNQLRGRQPSLALSSLQLLFIFSTSFLHPLYISISVLSHSYPLTQSRVRALSHKKNQPRGRHPSGARLQQSYCCLVALHSEVPVKNNHGEVKSERSRTCVRAHVRECMCARAHVRVTQKESA